MILKKETLENIENFINTKFIDENISPEMVAAITELIRVISILPKTNSKE